MHLVNAVRELQIKVPVKPVERQLGKMSAHSCGSSGVPSPTPSYDGVSSSDDEPVLEIHVSDDVLRDIGEVNRNHNSQQKKRKHCVDLDIPSKRAKIVGKSNSQPMPLLSLLICTPQATTTLKSSSQIQIEDQISPEMKKEFSDCVVKSGHDLPDVASFWKRLSPLSYAESKGLFYWLSNFAEARYRYFRCFMEYFAKNKKRGMILRSIKMVQFFKMERYLVDVVAGLVLSGVDYATAAYDVLKLYPKPDIALNRDVFFDIITDRLNTRVELFAEVLKYIATQAENVFSDSQIDRLLKCCIASAKRTKFQEEQDKYILTPAHTALYKVVNKILLKKRATEEFYGRIDMDLMKNYYIVHGSYN